MLFQVLKRLVRIEHRVLVIETGDEAERHQAVRHRVEEGAAELLHPQWIAERVDNGAGLDPVLRDLPQLLDADGIELRLLPGVERQPAHELLGQVAADAVAEDRDLGPDVDPCLERRLLRAVLVDALVAGADADDAIVLVEDLRCREAGEEIDPFGLDLTRPSTSRTG